jgi:hypothetical protein
MKAALEGVSKLLPKNDSTNREGEEGNRKGSKKTSFPTHRQSRHCGDGDLLYKMAEKGVGRGKKSARGSGKEVQDAAACVGEPPPLTRVAFLQPGKMTFVKVKVRQRRV